MTSIARDLAAYTAGKATAAAVRRLVRAGILIRLIDGTTVPANKEA